MIKPRIQRIAITLTIATTISYQLPAAQAQTNGVRGTIGAPGASSKAECQTLAKRMEKLDKMEHDRVMRDEKKKRKRSSKSLETIYQQRADIQTKMFFAKCE